jgi:hypothetical protein
MIEELECGRAIANGLGKQAEYVRDRPIDGGTTEADKESPDRIPTRWLKWRK